MAYITMMIENVDLISSTSARNHLIDVFLIIAMILYVITHPLLDAADPHPISDFRTICSDVPSTSEPRTTGGRRITGRHFYGCGSTGRSCVWLHAFHAIGSTTTQNAGGRPVWPPRPEADSIGNLEK